MPLLIAKFVVLVCFLVAATSVAPARAAAWLAPAEPLTQTRLEALVAPALPPGEGYEIAFSQPALPMHNPASVHASLQLLDLRHDQRNEHFIGSLLVRLETGEQTVIRLAGTARAQVEILVPSRTVAAGEALTAELLQPLTVAQRQLRHDSLVDAADLQGVEARRRLLAGRPIRQGDVQSVRLVRRGDTVELIYRAPGLDIAAAARALEDGSRGGLVAVANLASGQRLAGVVMERGKVVVERPPRSGR